MRIIKSDFDKHKKKILGAVKRGAIFIYPTDTIYGIGCDATNDKSVKKIRIIKERDTKPFSVIAPGKEWIEENCEVGDGKELEKLPGPFTLIYKLKNKGAVAESVNPEGDSLGVRIPDHWFSSWVREVGVPFVTTSVNLAGSKHMEKLSDVDEMILGQVDVIIYEREKRGESSTKVNLTSIG